MIDLSNGVIKKEIPENKNPDEVINIAENILDFSKLQKDKVFKILTPKQMLQKLQITLAQVKVGNTSEKVLNEIHQVIYSLYRAKEIIKKVYNNMTNSIKL